MAGAASQWIESEMDAAKIQALVDSEKIPKEEFVKWFEAAGQQRPSGKMGQIPVFQAFCECGLRLPAHPFLTLVLEYYGVELVNLVPNSITMLSVFVYLCEAYLGIPADLELFRYYYGMTRLGGVVGSCSLKLHDGKSKEYIPMSTRSCGHFGRRGGSAGRSPTRTASLSSGSQPRRFLLGTRLLRKLVESSPSFEPLWT